MVQVMFNSGKSLSLSLATGIELLFHMKNTACYLIYLFVEQSRATSAIAFHTIFINNVKIVQIIFMLNTNLITILCHLNRNQIKSKPVRFGGYK